MGNTDPLVVGSNRLSFWVCNSTAQSPASSAVMTFSLSLPSRSKCGLRDTSQSVSMGYSLGWRTLCGSSSASSESHRCPPAPDAGRP
eukprot:4682039-Amphidinium_carterae.2